MGGPHLSLAYPSPGSTGTLVTTLVLPCDSALICQCRISVVWVVSFQCRVCCVGAVPDSVASFISVMSVHDLFEDSVLGLIDSIGIQSISIQSVRPACGQCHKCMANTACMWSVLPCLI